jgi:TonB family protein
MRNSGVASFRASGYKIARQCLAVRVASFAVAGALLLVGPLPRAQADVIKRKLLEHANPSYPSQAKRLGVEGSVILRIVIEPDGHVSDVRVTSGDPMLTDAAEDAARHWKYSTSPQSSVSFVQVSFSLK